MKCDNNLFKIKRGMQLYLARNFELGCIIYD